MSDLKDSLITIRRFRQFLKLLYVWQETDVLTTELLFDLKYLKSNIENLKGLFTPHTCCSMTMVGGPKATVYLVVRCLLW